ncbi:MAG TPA: hypothetical protein VMZ51_03810 [Acidimicrobiales bacterium]|nr:hypothetical protein [Acidimicrobiales bacterium]
MAPRSTRMGGMALGGRGLPWASSSKPNFKVNEALRVAPFTRARRSFFWGSAPASSSVTTGASPASTSVPVL